MPSAGLDLEWMALQRLLGVFKAMAASSPALPRMLSTPAHRSEALRSQQFTLQGCQDLSVVSFPEMGHMDAGQRATF